MKEISLELIAEIREYINEPLINNRLRLLEFEKWLQATAALDTIEDSTNAINYYMSNNAPLTLGGLYLHIYGLLQALNVSQDCIVSLRKSLINKMTKFEVDSPDIYYVRNIRNDILHATDRGKVNKSYIYLTQWSLSQPYFEYQKQLSESAETIFTKVNVEELIKKNNKEVNRFLEEIKMGLKRELETKKEEYSKHKLLELFNGLNYAAEKLSENSYMAQWGYESTKKILQKYKNALNERYVSWEECCSDSYEIQFINDIYDILDGDTLQKSNIPGVKRELIKKILVDDLLYHFRKLRELSEEHDEYCTESTEQIETDCELTINIVSPKEPKISDY